MNYTEATRLSRQMSGGLTKTALEGWQRAGLGATGGGLLAYTMASLINPSMSRRGKLLSTLAGMGTGAAAGYRFLPGYGSGKATAGTGNGGNAGTATTDTGTATTQSPAKAPAQTAAKTPAKTQTKAPAQTQAPAQTATQAPAQAPAQRPPRKLTPAEVERYGRTANNIINSIVGANAPFARDLPRLTLQYGPAAPVLTTLVGAGKRVLDAQRSKQRARRNPQDFQAVPQPPVSVQTPETAPEDAQKATPAVDPVAALAGAPASAAMTGAPTPAQEDDDVSGAVYRTLGGLGLGLGGAGLYAGNKALKNRRVRQFGARRQQVREDQDAYAAWNAALEELAHRPQVEMPPTTQQAPAQTQAPSAAQGKTQAQASGKRMWKGNGKMSIRRRASGAKVLALLAGLAPALYGSLDRD